ncbi:hypothetical protein J437_LFUL003917 [Ladona fulva]|uniref:G-protein coupled receptors family 1 profile domain-containing protein n=1 Tax=Ladona fulva TaxID=123851 RepID=A0A8K0P4U5_LADFU|nr:hypothetical protein J437_LFUL003917 [Ladona fulva]
MGREDCSGCRLSNDSLPPDLSSGFSSPSPEPETGNPPVYAIVFIATAGVLCIVSNVIFAVSMFRTCESSRDRTKATRLRGRLRILLLNLSAVDLASVALLAPFEILILAKEWGEWEFGTYCCRLFMGLDVILGSSAAYGVATIAIYSVRLSTTWPITVFSWLISASLSVPVFALADVVSLPGPSGPLLHCSLPLALSSGDLRPPVYALGEPLAPSGLLLLRLAGATLGFVLPTFVILVSNVEAVVRYFRANCSDDPEEDAVRDLKDESMKLCFVLSLSHVISTFPRFVLSVLFLFAPASASTSLRIPPLASPINLQTALLLSMLHYSAPAANVGKEEPVSPEKVNIVVKVTVFYEALCPDSRNFFIRQLLPSYEKAPHLLDVVLVPYGKAKTQLLPGEGRDEGILHFSCQHGPVECQANKVHACAIKYVKKPDILKYITCMISDNTSPEEIGRTCAMVLGIDWLPIQTCSTTLEGDILLRDYGEATHSLRPHVSFIPTVLLDGNQDRQAAILKDLFKEICLKLQSAQPPECA